MRTSLKVVVYFFTAFLRFLPASGNRISNGICKDGSENVNSFVGLSVSIACKYPLNLANNVKRFCRVDEHNCLNIISALSSNTTWKDRYTLLDYREQNLYRVTIRELTLNDTGKYQCHVDHTAKNCVMEINLAIKKLDDIKPTVITGVLGGTAQISCEYPSSHQDDEKCVCKGEDPHTCEVQKINVIKDFKRFPKTYFRANIEYLSEKDFGVYWCCSNTTWRHGLSRLIILPPTSPKKKNNDSSSKKASEAPKEIDGSGASSRREQYIHKVISGVATALLLMAASLVLYKLMLRWKTGHTADRRGSAQHNTTKETQEDPQYEEIREQPCAQTSVSPVTSIYVTVNHPEENLHYASVSFQKHSEEQVELNIAACEA